MAIDNWRKENVESSRNQQVRAASSMASETQPRLLADDEWQRQVVEWNATETDVPQNRCLHELFEAQVELCPESVAIVFEQEQITYRALNERANQLAHHLHNAGVMPEIPVALLIERGIDFVAAILAVFKAGGALLPLDPQSPFRRHYEILKQSQCHYILTIDKYMPALTEALEEFDGEQRPETILIERVFQKEEVRENILSGSKPGNLAYIMYTSGSTGVPKGAMVEQAGMINHIYAKIADLGISKEDRLAQNSPPTFDIVIWQCLAALLVGGQVQVFKDEIAHDPLQLLKQTNEQHITVLQVVPSVLRAMVQQAEISGEERPRLSKLRWIVPTGDALSPELCRQWFQLYPTIPMLNNCGSTECSDDNCHYAIYEPPPSDYPLSMMPIGRPIQNIRAYILDHQLRPIPIGEIGDLYIGGIGVGRGYLNDPEKTTEVFLPDPFSQEPGARLYKTRDRARYLPDGVIQFLGRSDNLIKIRGQRIEPSEIEAVLEQHPELREAIVLARETTGENKYLAAYVVPVQGTTPTGEDLRSYLRDKLPEYMIPAAFVFLDAFPLNPHGKIDRRALPTPEQIRLDSQESYVAPATPVQKELVQIWEELLEVRPIGIRDNFFELGGHSLLAVQLVYKIEQLWGRKISTATLLEESTIEHLANVLEEPVYANPDVVAANNKRNKEGRPFFSLKERMRRDYKRKDRGDRL
ncbi:MAG TPA: non-ribosomal peptide synthetase [Ktedonobacteraceae bacterium]|nr:non-ribosomal peptide synthetase [Ktedonobacteraceae bacterium]